MLGIDIVEIDALIKRSEKYGELFLRKIFTDQELSDNRSGLAQLNYKRLAAIFAAKEAVMKALGDGNMKWRDIEVISNSLRRPQVMLYGDARKLADRLGMDGIRLSLSYSKKHAIALAITTQRRA